MHTEILDKNRLSIFKQLAAFQNIGVLSGGTAIGLQIKHRKSFDFNIFIQKPISRLLKNKINKTFHDKFQIIRDEPHQLDIEVSRVKITFLHYPFPNLHPTIPTGPIDIFDIRDLASNKAHTIGRRGIWRDYVDLFFIIKERHTTLSTIIQEAEKRFKGEFNQKLLQEQLIYTKDITDFDIEYLRESYKPQQILEFFEKITRDHARKILQQNSQA